MVINGIHPLVQQIWDIADVEPWEPDQQLERSRGVWNAEQIRATATAARISFLGVHYGTLAAGDPSKETAALQVHAPSPDPEALEVLGPPRRSSAIANGTWQHNAATEMVLHTEIPDTELPANLRWLSADFKGAGVYMFCYWAWSALSRWRAIDPKGHAARLSGPIGIHIRSIQESP